MTKLRWDRAAVYEPDPARIIEVERPLERNAQQRRQFVESEKKNAEVAAHRKAKDAAKAKLRGERAMRRQAQRVEEKRRALLVAKAAEEARKQELARSVAIKDEKDRSKRELASKLWSLLGLR